MEEKQSETTPITQVLSSSASQSSCIHEKSASFTTCTVTVTLLLFFSYYRPSPALTFLLHTGAFDSDPFILSMLCLNLKIKLKHRKMLNFTTSGPKWPTTTSTSCCCFTVKASQQHFRTSCPPSCCCCCASS